MENNLIKELCKCDVKTILIIEWIDMSIKGSILTIYETDNLLDLDDIEYKEYHACAIKILEADKNKLKEIAKKKGDWFELSIENAPVKISLEDGTVIWKNDNSMAYFKIPVILGCKEYVDFKKCIGQYYDIYLKKYIETTKGVIHYDMKNRAWIVPCRPY